MERDQERDASDEPAHDLPMEGAEREGARVERKATNRVRAVLAAAVAVVAADPKVVTRAANVFPPRKVTVIVVRPTRKVASGARHGVATVIAAPVAISSAGRRQQPRDDSPKDSGDFNEFDADFDDDDLMEVSGGGDDAGDALFDADSDDMDTSERSAVPAGHRSIPSWDEAIGMIVDTNLATRTDRRRGGPPSGPNSGPSRGRPRGGRRRKKS